MNVVHTFMRDPSVYAPAALLRFTFYVHSVRFSDLSMLPGDSCSFLRAWPWPFLVQQRTDLLWSMATLALCVGYWFHYLAKFNWFWRQLIIHLMHFYNFVFCLYSKINLWFVFKSMINFNGTVIFILLHIRLR